MKKFLGPLLSILLLGGVAIAVIVSLGGKDDEEPSQAELPLIEGLTGSEKIPFFQDERVQVRFAELGYRVVAHKAGSRQIATSPELQNYAFAFPSGTPAATKILAAHKGSKAYNPFFAPMVIASWQPIADLLKQNGVVTEREGYLYFDSAKYLELAEARTRWSDLQGNQNREAYPTDKLLLISSTDVRKSNSAAMYLSLASYLANARSVVNSEAEATQVLPLMTHLFQGQGFTEFSSAVPFQDYLVMGMGKAPLTFIYESQFIEKAIANDGSLRDEMRLLMPQPTVLSKHVLIGLNDEGKMLGEWLETDETLQQLAAEYGFRTRTPAHFEKLRQQHDLPVLEQFIDVIDPPSYEMVERMITEIESSY